MEVVYVLLPVALLVAAAAVGLFLWAVRSGQFEDLETPAIRILFDDEPAPPPPDGEPGAEPDEEGGRCRQGERQGS